MMEIRQELLVAHFVRTEKTLESLRKEIALDIVKFISTFICLKPEFDRFNSWRCPHKPIIKEDGYYIGYERSKDEPDTSGFMSFANSLILKPNTGLYQFVLLHKLRNDRKHDSASNLTIPPQFWQKSGY